MPSWNYNEPKYIFSIQVSLSSNKCHIIIALGCFYSTTTRKRDDFWSVSTFIPPFKENSNSTRKYKGCLAEKHTHANLHKMQRRQYNWAQTSFILLQYLSKVVCRMAFYLAIYTIVQHRINTGIIRFLLCDIIVLWLLEMCYYF